MIKRPGHEVSVMAICAVLTEPVSYMIPRIRILVEMTADTGRCRIPVGAVSMTLLAFRRSMLTDQGIACLTVIKLSGMPCLFIVALGAIQAAELVEMRIDMALVTISVRPFILTLCLVAARTKDIIMDPF
jgi:hypothetical protein